MFENLRELTPLFFYERIVLIVLFGDRIQETYRREWSAALRAWVTDRAFALIFGAFAHSDVTVKKDDPG